MTRISRAELLREMARALAAADIENPSLDARVLLLGALGIDAVALASAPEALVNDTEISQARDFLQRRLQREPVARILGEREFYGLNFSLNEATLVPRPDTETVVDVALSLLRDREKAWRIIDLGTGTGAIAIALLSHLPNAFAVGLDLSSRAAHLSRCNAERHGVGDRFNAVVGCWGASIDGRFDLIVSNPPYIRSKDIVGLDAEVRFHDPLLALDGGAAGLDAYRAILSDAERLLAPDGSIVLELGIGQSEDVASIARQMLFRPLEVVRDYSGIERVLVLDRPQLVQ